MNKWSEALDVVPLVEKLLVERGYTWQREVTVEGGRIDFLATHTVAGDVLIVEAKALCHNADKVVAQVTGYAEALGVANAKLAIALPKTEIRESLEALCERRGIEVIGVDCQIRIEVPAPSIPTKYPRLLSFEEIKFLGQVEMVQKLNPEGYAWFLEQIRSIKKESAQ